MLAERGVDGRLAELDRALVTCGELADKVTRATELDRALTARGVSRVKVVGASELDTCGVVVEGVVARVIELDRALTTRGVVVKVVGANELDRALITCGVVIEGVVARVTELDRALICRGALELRVARATDKVPISRGVWEAVELDARGTEVAFVSVFDSERFPVHCHQSRRSAPRARVKRRASAATALLNTTTIPLAHPLGCHGPYIWSTRALMLCAVSTTFIRHTMMPTTPKMIIFRSVECNRALSACCGLTLLLRETFEAPPAVLSTVTDVESVLREYPFGGSEIEPLAMLEGFFSIAASMCSRCRRRYTPIRIMTTNIGIRATPHANRTAASIAMNAMLVG